MVQRDQAAGAELPELETSTHLDAAETPDGNGSAPSGWTRTYSIRGIPIHETAPDASLARIHMKAEATEATVSALASKLTYGGGTAAVIGGFTANEIAAFGGLAVAIIGLAVQFYYKRKEDRRRTAQHNKFMGAMHLPPEAEE